MGQFYASAVLPLGNSSFYTSNTRLGEPQSRPVCFRIGAKLFDSAGNPTTILRLPPSGLVTTPTILCRHIFSPPTDRGT